MSGPSGKEGPVTPGALEGIRTPGPFLRREVLYPAELLAHDFRQYTKKERPRACPGPFNFSLSPYFYSELRR